MKFETENYYGEIWSDPDRDRGWFEHKVEGDSQGGGLWFDGKELIDYDGVFALAKELCEKLREMGYVVSDDCEAYK